MTSYVDRQKGSKGYAVKEARLAQSVAEEIRSLIVQGGMSAGDQLPTESELMARFA
ncbi:MAG: GntR family transcriptional regulator, partial [Clostridia bacterium]|nr:GntR family transcriptional regulator [Clostridia bacterium]